jgi:exonuclease III
MGSATFPNRQNGKITIMEWNIRHGGSTGRLPSIIKTIREHNPDILVLTEFRRNTCELILRSALTDMGYEFQVVSDVPEKTNGILVAAKMEMQQETDPVTMHRLLPMYVPLLDLHLLGAHIPGSGDKWDKRECWDRVLDYAKRHGDKRTMIIGDFNTGLPEDAEGTPFALPEKMQELRDSSYIDAWRSLHRLERGYTWWSTAGNGFRLDYAYLSPPLASMLSDARHSHRERLEGYSDHSSLLVVIGATGAARKTAESGH